MEKINFHTHTTFCDGKNSPEEMILTAIQKGFSILGFSAHSLLHNPHSWHIKPESYDAYQKEIMRLKEKYADKITIYYGFEADYFCNESIPSKESYKKYNPDFLIGSVHYVVSKKGYYSVDNSVDKVRDNLIRLYGKADKGFESIDGKKAVCEYFDAERQMLKKGDFEILGHCDLIKLRNSVLHFFDESESWYKKELKATAKTAAKAGVIAEINTGAVGRKLMNDFYPSEYFLSLLHDYKVPVCINTDTHSIETIDCAYEQAVLAAKKAGYDELIYPFAARIKI